MLKKVALNNLKLALLGPLLVLAQDKKKLRMYIYICIAV